MSERTWSHLISALLNGTSLTADDTKWAMNEIMSGSATDAQIAGFAIALRAKGESVAEVRGLAQGMLDHAVTISVPGATLDIVGTGGDRAHTVNVSTMASIVASAAGARVVKHGNRAASSSCGTADVLERLGVIIDLDPADAVAVAEEVDITFCFAPLYHPSLKYAAKPRRELAVPTVFNFLGPLTNPARPTASAIGVFDRNMCEIMAGVFAERGVNALVFRGDDGLDELTTSTTSRVVELHEGELRTWTVDPAALGLEPHPREAVVGGDPATNAALARRVLEGEASPHRDIVTLNAAAGALTAGLVDDLAAGLELARSTIDSGAAAAALDRLVACSNAG